MDEALDLSESVASRGANVDESFEKTVRQVRCRAAFISLKVYTCSVNGMFPQ